MNKTIKIEGGVWFDSLECMGQEGFFFAPGGMVSSYFEENGYIPIAPYTIEIEMPEGLDLHKAQLKSLQEKRKLILAENEQRLNAIDNEIANLMAIEDKS